MVKVFDKNNQEINFAEKKDIYNMKFLPFNLNKRINIVLNMTKNGGDGTPDKATVLVFGSHNGDPFLTLIQTRRNSNEYLKTDLVGNVGVSNISQADDGLMIKINTSAYGSIAVVSTAGILSLYGVD